MNGMDIHKLEDYFREKFEDILNGFFEEDREDIKRFCQESLIQGIKPARLIKYLYTLRPLSRELGKPFCKASKEDLQELIARIETSNYSEWTKHDRKVILRKYLRFLGKEDLITWKIKTVRNNDKLPEEILTEEEVKRIAEAAYFKRDKAFILALYESGARIGEFLPLKIKHLSFDEYGAILHVRGKTGSRRIRLIASAPALQEWIEEHPAKEDPEAYLWCKVPTPNNPKWKNEPLSYNYTCRMIKELAKKAGVKKKVNPHAFRHARATFLANFLTEAQMKEFFGWVGDSDMAAIYVHLSGRDVDNALLNVYGIKEGEKAKEPVIKIKKCPRCGETNDPAAKFCKRCYLPLDQPYNQRDKLEALLVSFFQELAERFPEVKELFAKVVEREKAEDLISQKSQ